MLRVLSWVVARLTSSFLPGALPVPSASFVTHVEHNHHPTECIG